MQPATAPVVRRRILSRRGALKSEDRTGLTGQVELYLSPRHSRNQVPRGSGRRGCLPGSLVGAEARLLSRTWWGKEGDKLKVEGLLQRRLRVHRGREHTVCRWITDRSSLKRKKKRKREAGRVSEGSVTNITSQSLVPLSTTLTGRGPEHAITLSVVVSGATTEGGARMGAAPLQCRAPVRLLDDVGRDGAAARPPNSLTEQPESAPRRNFAVSSPQPAVTRNREEECFLANF